MSLSVARGQTLALVGESGCGKTTPGRAILRLIEPDEGRVELDGVDVTALDPEPLRALRRRMQMIFQDPYASLNPRLSVGAAIRGPMEVHRIPDAKEKVGALLERVGLSARYAERYPHEFSGGQRQRIGTARAIAVEPDLIVADEPVSALDVSVQAQILNLLADLRDAMGLTLVFIAHDLSVVRHLADDVAVMYLGRVVERPPRDAIFSEARHPYTQSLLSAVPRIGRREKRVILGGEVPSPVNPPAGCALHPRCPLAFDRCRSEVPENHQVSDGHRVACHLYDGSSELVSIRR
ncbi:MAG: oligopeptide/dipeptide ABC transporter ATP-binding protein [Myxococcota bacterium]